MCDTWGEGGGKREAATPPVSNSQTMEPHHLGIPLGMTGFLPQPGRIQDTRHAALCIVFLGRIVCPGANGGAEKGNYYEQSRYTYENKQNIDKMTARKSDI